LSEEPPVLVKILLLLDAGNYPSKIARILGFSKQKVRYWVKAAEREGLVIPKSRDVVTLYQLTWKGRETSKKFLTGGEVVGRSVRLHAFSVKYPILVEPEVSVDWDKVRMQNWDRFVGSEAGLRVEKTSRHLIVHADRIYGSDPWQLFFLAYRQCDRVSRYLESKFRMKLGAGELLRKPHFAVMDDPVAKHLAGVMEFSDDIGKLDESEGEGELDLYDPNFVKNYLVSFTTLPALVCKMGVGISEVKAVLLALAENIKLLSSFDETLKFLDREIKDHLALIQEYRNEAEKRAEDSSNLIREVRGSVAALTESVQALKIVVDGVNRRRRRRPKRRIKSRFTWLKSFLEKLIR